MTVVPGRPRLPDDTVAQRWRVALVVALVAAVTATIALARSPAPV